MKPHIVQYHVHFFPPKDLTAFIKNLKNVIVFPLSAVSVTSIPVSGQTHPKSVFRSFFRCG